MILNPQRHWTWYRIGLTHEALGDKVEATTAYGHALSIKPDFVEAQQKRQQL